MKLRSIKRPLLETIATPPWFPKTHEELEAVIAELREIDPTSEFNANDDLTVSVDGDMELQITGHYLNKEGRLPCQFAPTDKVTIISSGGLGRITSLAGLPKTCDILIMRDMHNVQTPDYFPRIIGGGVRGGMLSFNLISPSTNPWFKLSEIAKRIERIDASILLPIGYFSPLLSLLRLKGDVRVANSHLTKQKNPKQSEALDIVNWHLERDRNVLQCQEDLIDNGLDIFADF